MNQKTIVLLNGAFLFTMISCVIMPPTETVFVSSYKHRIVRADAAKHGRTTIVHVYHEESFSEAERKDLIRWYKNKHHLSSRRVKVIFIGH
jgi:hypothetical protein